MMNYKPLVSIVIPVYKGERYVAEAIDSALNQTYKNIEVLVINDGSPDSYKIRDAVSPFLNEIQYIEKKNDNTNHAAELKNAPGRICFVLKFSLGKKRYIMIKTTINVKNARKKRIVAKNTCLFSRTGSKRYN